MVVSSGASIAPATRRGKRRYNGLPGIGDAMVGRESESDRSDPATDWPDPWDLPPGHNEVEFYRLVRALRLSRGFTVFFACCNHLGQREEIIERLVREMPDFSLGIVRFTGPIDDLLHYLRRNPVPGPVAAVSFSGLELSVGVERARKTDLVLRNLNLARNTFPGEFPYPFLFWVTDELLRRWTDRAPDFFSVRSAVLFFAMPEPVRDVINRELIKSDEDDGARLRPQERRERIEYLSGLLQEAQSHPDERRDPLLEAQFLSMLANLYYQEGDFLQAMDLYKNALETCERVLGPEHPDVATSLNNLAGLLESTGRYTEAEPLYRRAIEIMEKVLGKEHPSTQTVRGNLGRFLQAQGKRTDPW